MDEVQRIKEAYKRRGKRKENRYSYFFSQQRRSEIKKAINDAGMVGLLMNKRILDIGCGHGEVLSYFLEEGVSPRNLHGIDLLSERIEEAQRLYPGVSFTCTNAERLPYADLFFDIITQSTAFTSILDLQMKKRIANEMLRILKNDGIIIWHDYRFNNPFNRDVKGIKKEEIMALFENCNFSFHSMNLNAFIARPLAQFSWKLCEQLERIPFLRTHWLVTIRKSAK